MDKLRNFYASFCTRIFHFTRKYFVFVSNHALSSQMYCDFIVGSVFIYVHIVAHIIGFCFLCNELQQFFQCINNKIVHVNDSFGLHNKSIRPHTSSLSMCINAWALWRFLFMQYHLKYVELLPLTKIVINDRFSIKMRHRNVCYKKNFRSIEKKCQMQELNHLRAMQKK